MSKILLVGGAGFIGSHLVQHFSQQGHTLGVLDSLTLYNAPLQAYELASVQERVQAVMKHSAFFRGDAANEGEAWSCISKFKPDYVIHLAGTPLLSISDQNPHTAYREILGTTTSILNSLRLYGGVKRFVYFSSSTVYGDFTHDIVSEQYIPRPKNVYGGAKLAGEALVQSFCTRFQLPFTIIRPSAVYGPNDINRRVVQVFLENAIQGIPSDIRGATSKLDFTYVSDLVRGIGLCLFEPKAEGEIFNITRGEGRSLSDLFEIVRSVVGRAEATLTDHEAHMPRRGTLSIEKANKLLGYVSEVSLEDGVAEYHRNSSVIRYITAHGHS